jgi:hypothetical protein
MKAVANGFLSLLLLSAMFTPSMQGAPVEYVRVCDSFGTGFYYVPGTENCFNPQTGDTRVNTEGGVWRTIQPYPEGRWVNRLRSECRTGRLVKVGTYQSSDFTANVWTRKQTAPFTLELADGQFISTVFMSGGFYDPRTPNVRSGVNGTNGLCLRSVDPTVLEAQGDGTSINPPFGNQMLPIGCVANSRIVNMPGIYAVNATAAYPNVDEYLLDPDQKAGPYKYGRQLVVTTDMGVGRERLLEYLDPVTGPQPLAGSLSVWVCVQSEALPLVH